MNIDYEDYDSVDDKYEKKKEVKPSKPVQIKKSKKKILTPDEIFRSAVKNFRRENYNGVVELMQPFVEEYQRHILGLKLLSFSLIYTGYPDDARRFLKRILDVNRNEGETLNALAYLELMKGNTNAALNFLLDAVYVDKDNEKLTANLEKIRGMKDPKIFVSMHGPAEFLFIDLPKPKLSDIVYDKIKEGLKTKSARMAAGGVALLVAGFIFYAFWPQITNLNQQWRSTRLGFDMNYHVSIKDIEELMEERESFSISLTEDEASQKYALIRQNIEDGNRNMALFLINQIINSDAPELIKERTLIMKEFVPDADTDNIDYIPAYSDVAVASFLYEDVFIKWNGTIANLEHLGRDETVFDLLINFVDEAIVDGVAEAHFDDYIHIMNGEKITLYGEVVGITLDNAVIIDGYQIIRLD